MGMRTGWYPSSVRRRKFLNLRGVYMDVHQSLIVILSSVRHMYLTSLSHHCLPSSCLSILPFIADCLFLLSPLAALLSLSWSKRLTPVCRGWVTDYSRGQRFAVHHIDSACIQSTQQHTSSLASCSPISVLFLLLEEFAFSGSFVIWI